MTESAAASHESGIARWREGDARGAITLIERALALPWPGWTSTDVDSYIRGVSGRSGFGPDEHLNLGDRDTMARLIAAMSKQENAKSNYTPQTVVTILNQTRGSATVSASQLAVPQLGKARRARCDLLNERRPFADHRRLVGGKACDVPARMCVIRNEARANRIGYRHKDDRYRVGLLEQSGDCWGRLADDHIGA